MIKTNASAVNAPTPGCVCSRRASGHFSASCSIACVNSAIVGVSRSSNSSRSRRRRLAHGANANDSSCFRPLSRHSRFLQRKTPNADGSWTESVLHSFNGSASDGAIPLASVIFDAVGNLYGTTSGGDHSNGNVFELTPNADGSWTESVLHSFDGYDGSSPQAGLIFDAAGNLYGTAGGGAYGKGTVFKLTPNGDASWTE